MVVSKVAYIKVGTSDENDFCSVLLESGDLLWLWWDAVFTVAGDHVKRNMWISLLRDAMVNDQQVELLTDADEDSLVVTVKTYAP